MDMQTVLFELIMLFCSFVGYFLIQMFLPSYFSKKGENLATKEDIAEITRIVEKTKNLATKEDIGEITKIAEEVKRQISIVGASQISLLSEERNALLAYLENTSIAFNAYTNSPIIDFGTFDTDNATEIQKEWERLYLKAILSRSKVDVFIDNQEISNLIFKMQKLLAIIQRDSTLSLLRIAEARIDLASDKIDSATYHQKFIDEVTFLNGKDRLDEYFNVYYSLVKKSRAHIYSLIENA